MVKIWLLTRNRIHFATNTWQANKFLPNSYRRKSTEIKAKRKEDKSKLILFYTEWSKSKAINNQQKSPPVMQQAKCNSKNIAVTPPPATATNHTSEYTML